MTISTITSISSPWKPVNSAQFTLTINGTNFTTGSVVYLDGVVLSKTYISTTQLTVVISANKMLVAHSYYLEVGGVADSDGIYKYLTLVAGNPQSYSNGEHARAYVNGYYRDYSENQSATFQLPELALAGRTHLFFHPYAGSLLFIGAKFLLNGVSVAQVGNCGFDATCGGYDGIVYIEYNQIKVFGAGWAAGAACELDVTGVDRSLSNSILFEVIQPSRVYTFGVVFP